MNTDDMFARATREAFRYASAHGFISTEQLWQLPLIGRGQNAGFDLDSVARTINAEIKALGEESFVEKENPQRAVAVARLEVVKAVIAYRQAEAKAQEKRAADASERKAILEALDNRKRADLSAASVDELKARLAALDPV